MTSWAEQPWWVWPAAVDPAWCVDLAERLRHATFREEALGLHGNFCYDRLEDEAIEEEIRARLEDPELVAALSARVGRPLAPQVEGAVKRLRAIPSHRFPWHADGSRGREIALSLALSATPVEGGCFQLRRKWSRTPAVELRQGQPGDVHVFEVADLSWVHRVTPVEGSAPRVFFAGWYRASVSASVDVPSTARPLG